ncbi:Hint domain-containing protein [Antarctobacter sp.]|uniref:Hint domain-containing protein n=1 Tax=Antarctobacter sp. TaxID=1872577 RepID=UPI003A9133EA
MFPVETTDDSGIGLGQVRPGAYLVTGGLPGGARIKTLRGERRASELRPGDPVLTRDNGYQPLRWTGRIVPGPVPGMTIRIRKGALGRGVPDRVLLVAPGQRFLVGGARLRHLLGLAEATVTATQLTGLKGVSALSDRPTAFVQLLFDRHELLLAEGAWTDSLLVTAEFLDQVPGATCDAPTCPLPPARPPVPPQLLQALLGDGRDNSP